jgi:hypothetical protein
VTSTVLDAPAEAVTGLSVHAVVGRVGAAKRARTQLINHMERRKAELQQAFKGLNVGDDRVAFSVKQIENADIKLVNLAETMLASCFDSDWRQLVASHAESDGRSLALTAARLLREFLSEEIELYLPPRPSTLIVERPTSGALHDEQHNNMILAPVGVFLYI